MNISFFNNKEPIRNEFLPPFRPFIGDDEINEVIDTLRSDWITTGPKTLTFEKLFREYVKSKNALAVSSCTAALHLGLAAIGVGRGDEVITSPITFASTANVILHQGAKPVFVDIQIDSYNIDPEKIREKITNKTKAIIPVHYGGNPCELDEILEIAEDNNLFVIEDAAHAIGSSYKNRKIGGIGDITCFSFYATKNITTGEGGMVTTNDNELSDKIKILSLHGISKDAWKRYSSKGNWYYEVLAPGYKYNMTDIQAAIGMHQLKKLDNFIKIKKRIAEIYLKEFAGMPEIILPQIKNYVLNSWHLFPIRLKTSLLKIDRNKFIDLLKENNIGTSVHFIPIHMHPYYKNTFGFKDNDFPIAKDVYYSIISIPIYPKMTENDAYDVVNAIKKIIDEHGVK